MVTATLLVQQHCCAPDATPCCCHQEVGRWAACWCCRAVRVTVGARASIETLMSARAGCRAFGYAVAVRHFGEGHIRCRQSSVAVKLIIDHIQDKTQRSVQAVGLVLVLGPTPAKTPVRGPERCLRHLSLITANVPDRHPKFLTTHQPQPKARGRQPENTEDTQESRYVLEIKWLLFFAAKITHLSSYSTHCSSSCTIQLGQPPALAWA